MLAQVGCLPGTCTNQRSPYCLFLWVGNKSNTCHIRASSAESPEEAPPFCTSEWDGLTWTSASKCMTCTPSFFSHPEKPHYKESNFSNVRCWVFWKQECLCEWEGPFANDSNQLQKTKKKYSQYMSQPKRADKEQETNLEGGKRRKASLG